MFLVSRIFFLQILAGDEFIRRSRENIEQFLYIPAHRGEIYDRNFTPMKKNIPLVYNRVVFNIYMIPEKSHKKKDDIILSLYQEIRNLNKIINIGEDVIREKLNTARIKYEPVLIKSDVTPEEIIEIAEQKEKFPRVIWKNESKRIYRYNNFAAHLLGYIGKISRNDLIQLKDPSYHGNQSIGKMGIERQYDKVLRGTDGKIKKIVNVRSKVESQEVDLEPVPGNNLILTIDYNIQRAAEEALKHYKKAAAVVIRAGTGEILAMISKPDFNPNEFSFGISKERWDEVANDP
ncbi:MAG: hypothetical protein KAS39_06085, partial [Actinomycetia bacterium]|nr:hypothetical protein [Actinomycetes bacterium]